MSMGCLTDASQKSHSFLGFAFATCDMIQCGVMWQQILLCSHVIHIYMGLMNALSCGFT